MQKRELQSLGGHLNHSCKVIRLGQQFLRGIFGLLSQFCKQDHMIRLNTAFRADLEWWRVFASSWNGVSLMKDVAHRLKFGQTFQLRGGVVHGGGVTGSKCSGVSGQFIFRCFHSAKGASANHHGSSNLRPTMGGFDGAAVAATMKVLSQEWRGDTVKIQP